MHQSNYGSRINWLINDSWLLSLFSLCSKMECNSLATAIVLFVDFVDNISTIFVLWGSFKPRIMTYYSYRTKRSHELFYRRIPWSNRNNWLYTYPYQVHFIITITCRLIFTMLKVMVVERSKLTSFYVCVA